MHLSIKNALLASVGVLTFVLVGCFQDYKSSEDFPSRGRWVQTGLDQVRVNRLKVQGNTIFAATSRGLFSRASNNKNIPWDLLGLKNKEVVDFVFLTNTSLLAGVKPVTLKKSEVLIYRTDDKGSVWYAFHNNYGHYVSALVIHPHDSSILYARETRNIAKSTDGGLTWENVFLDWGYLGSSRFIQVDPKNPSIVWGGGSNAVARATITKSIDSGKSWETIQMGGASDVFDLVIHPNDSKTVLAGLMGFSNRIDKSTDGGKTWKVVNRSFGARALANSKLSDNVVYASGSHREGKLFFAYSTDYGDTWELELFKNGPDRMYVNDLLVIPQGQGEVLYLGTNKGLYKFGFIFPG